MKPNIQWVTQRSNALFNMYNNNSSSFHIYSGVKPTAAVDFTLSGSSPQLLFSTIALSSVFGRTANDYNQIFMDRIPASVRAIATGTATWFCAYINTNTFFIGSVSNVEGDAPMKLTTTSLAANTFYDIYSLAFTFHQ